MSDDPTTTQPPADSNETLGPGAPAVTPASETPEPASDSAESQPSQAPLHDAAEQQATPPSSRLQIGSQRSGDSAASVKAKPMAPAATSAPPTNKPSNYPPPNIRDALSPELEAEYLEALGGQSLDELIQSGAGAAVPAELASETRLTGRVSKIYRDDVFVDLGGGNQGTVPLRQFDQPPEVADELELLVVRLNADEGLYELTRPAAAVEVGNWEDVQEGQVVEVTVTGTNKGGLECQVAGIRGFMPMGQISLYRVESPEEYVGQRLACVVTEAHPDRRNLVLSHRAVMERERTEKREQLLAELATGQIREGVVRTIKDFGAFVDLGGVDGLVHISQLSWDRVNHPSEVVQVGQTVKVRVEKFDPDTGKVSLSHREAGANPWDDVESKYPVGARVTGNVSKVMDFGAFVKLEPGVEGLIHVSELAHGRIWRPSDVVSAEQEVEVKILSVDRDKQRISLSLKALLPPPEKEANKKPDDEDLAPPPEPTKVKKKHKQLKGGLGGPSGGEQFGLKW